MNFSFVYNMELPLFYACKSGLNKKKNPYKLLSDYSEFYFITKINLFLSTKISKAF